ncbi:MAG: hypothetical protein M0R80_10600 [Proteobacteria bacterium]|nr:hypothetical protein [Pseudomonadota bacterium]
MNTQPETTLEILTAIGSIATPVLLAIFTAVGWAIKRRIDSTSETENRLQERARKLEEELREDRLVVYNDILEPFIIIFTKDEGFVHDKSFKGKTKEQVVQEKILSPLYRKAVFKLSLFASDDVVRSYNRFLQFLYSQSDGSATADKAAQMMNNFGGLLLAIRRSVGNELTKLDNLEMLEWLVTDMASIRSEMKCG